MSATAFQSISNAFISFIGRHCYFSYNKEKRSEKSENPIKVKSSSA